MRLAARCANNPTAPLLITHRPAAAEGWLELLAQGMAFDLIGLAPAPPASTPDIMYQIGIEPALRGSRNEAVALIPGEHLAGGANLLPVVRAQLGLALALAALPGLRALAWGPARSAMAPAQFTQIVADWLAGGAFPVLALTALVRELDGGMRSEGLAFFTGQELRVEPLLGEDPAAVGKIAIRLIHSLVEAGPVTKPVELTGPDGMRLRAEPSGNGRYVRVWRNG